MCCHRVEAVAVPRCKTMTCMGEPKSTSANVSVGISAKSYRREAKLCGFVYARFGSLWRFVDARLLAKRLTFLCLSLGGLDYLRKQRHALCRI